MGRNESSSARPTGEAAVELYLDDRLEFETLVSVVGTRNAESVRASKAILERGDRIADDLAEL